VQACDESSHPHWRRRQQPTVTSALARIDPGPLARNDPRSLSGAGARNALQVLHQRRLWGGCDMRGKRFAISRENRAVPHLIAAENQC
jgi:hypothetical protein